MSFGSSYGSQSGMPPGAFSQQPNQFGQQSGQSGQFGQQLQGQIGQQQGQLGQQQGMVPPGYSPFASVTYNGIPTQVYEKNGFFGNSYYANITGLQKINFKNGQIIPLTSGGAKASKSRKMVGGSHKRRKRHGTRKHKRRH